LLFYSFCYPHDLKILFMKKLFVVLSAFFLVLNLLAQTPVDNFVHYPFLKNANISLLIREAGKGKVIGRYNADKSIVPASTLKLVTTASALELLGPDFRFQTKLEISGDITHEHILKGNLIIKGGGDPTLGSEFLGDKNFLDQWVLAIKQAGIDKIEGKIIADASIYNEEGVSPFWTWEDMGNYYAPSIFGISYLDNTFRLFLRSGSVGTTPVIIRTAPDLPDMVIENHLKSSTISFDSAYFYGMPNSNLRRLYGEIPANRTEFVVKGDIPNPVLLLAKQFSQKLSQNGITVSNPPVSEFSTPFYGRVIYTHFSPPLKDIIRQTNEKSNNHYAECLFRYLGVREGIPVTGRGGVKTIRNFWQSKGLPVNQLFMYDGSGLSPMNAVSAEFFTELLDYMYSKSAFSNDFFNSLPIAGKTGTLVSFLSNTPLEGKVFAKSGSIERVKCYAGYVKNGGKTYIFAIMVNNAHGTSKAVAQKIEELLLSVFK